MTVKYSGMNYPQINVQELFNGEHGIIAKTLGYNSLMELLEDSRKTYETDRHDPFLMKGMYEVVERIAYHIDKGSNIVIFGDFDVDGISASSVLFKGLLGLGIDESNLDVIIPNREVGYSIKKEYILEYVNNPIKNNPDLIITVDCGIKSAADVKFIRDFLGIEVVITDHHGVDPSMIPMAATAVVNPHLPGSEYPFKEISGSLVALKVMEGLADYLMNKEGRDPFIRGEMVTMAELRELAMLGTIADVMPILDENRWLVKETLSRLEVSYNLGLRIFTNELLKQYNKSKDKYLTTDFIGWQIGPRINAAGRIGDPYTGFYMFVTEDPIFLKEIFNILDNTNKVRQDILREEQLEASEIASHNQNRGIVYIKESVLDGVIGLIAGRLKEEYYKPTVVIGGKSIHLDLIYNRTFSNEEETSLYAFLYSLREYLKGKYEKDLFYGASIKDNKILFSIDENYIEIIEKEFKTAFLNTKEILYAGINAFIDEKYTYELREVKKKYNKEQYAEELKKIYPKLSDDYLYRVSEYLIDINTNELKFEYTTVLKGSCRSIEGFHITDALDFINEDYKRKTGQKLLLGFGGHPMAAGFGIEESKVEDFKNMFEDIANKNVTDDMMEKKLNVNIEIRDLGLIDERLINEMKSMGPFGNRNEFPKVLVFGRPIQANIIGKKQNTVKMFLEDNNGNKLEVLFFRYKDNPDIGYFCDEVINGNPQFTNNEIGIVGTLDLNEFNGVTTPQLIPIDIVLDYYNEN